MPFLEKLYQTDPDLYSDTDALSLCRYRLGSVLRQLYAAPLFFPHRASLSGALQYHTFTLDSPRQFARLFSRCLPEAYAELRWQDTPPGASQSRSEMLRIVAAGYRALRRRLGAIRTGPTPFPQLNDGDTWFRNHPDLPGRWAIEALVEHLRPQLGGSLSGFLVHGSVASNDIVPGFSDLDTMAVLSDEALTCEAELDAALRFLSSTHVHLLQFNPYMHHSHMLAGNMDFQAISVGTMPLCLFREGAYWGEYPAEAGLANSDLDCLLAFHPFDWFFEDWVARKESLSDAYEIIWWASSSILMPLLFAQVRDGMDRWKPDALAAVRSDLSPKDAELIDFLTTLRLNLNDLPVLSQDWWAAFPDDTHPALAAQHARILTSERDWVAKGITRERLANSVAAFRNIRQQSFRHWGGRRRRDFPVRSGWLSLKTPVSVTEHPRRAELCDYDDVATEFLTKAQEIDGVLAIYTFGQVGCPGLSDLDFLVVVDDSCRQESGILDNLLSGDSAALMGHGPIIVGRTAFQVLPAVFPIFHLDPLFGKLRAPEPTPLSESSAVPLVLSMLLTKYPVDLVYLRDAGCIRLRTLAAFLHSFGHFDRVLSSIGWSIPDSVTRCIELDRGVRASWSATGRLDWREMIDSFDAMFEASADLIVCVDQYLNGLRCGTQGSCGVDLVATARWSPFDGRAIEFTEPWSKKHLLDSLDRTTDPSASLAFPASIGRYLVWLTSGSGLASGRLRSRLHVETTSSDFEEMSKFDAYREHLNSFVSAELANGGTVAKYISLTTARPSEDTRRSKRVDHLEAVRDALEAYRLARGGYPVSSGGWDGRYTNWGRSGPSWIEGLVPEFLPELPQDPRNHSVPAEQYLYRSDGRDYKVIAHSPDDYEWVAAMIPQLIDPARTGWAYGFWTPNAASW